MNFHKNSVFVSIFRIDYIFKSVTDYKWIAGGTGE